MSEPPPAATAPYETFQPGAIVLPDGQARITVKCWARSVAVQLNHNGWKRTVEMPEVARHLFSVVVDDFAPGDRYAFFLDGNHDRAYPDPRSRFQPEGVHGPSQLVAANSFAWTDANWRNADRQDLIIYEMHIGTCTAEGTFRSAIEKIDQLVELGITAIELLPVVQSAGRWNWGYDGVNLFAPYEAYGTPDDLKAFVNACHDAGLAVILDVVYNHLGPEGNYLSIFGPYFSKKHKTPWGPAFNYDGRNNALARQWVLDNVIYWLEEFHFDGLRLDAIHFMFDDREETIVSEIAQAVREFGKERGQHHWLIGETNVFDQRMITPTKEGGLGFDAIWCDDLMHSLYSVGTPETQLTERAYLQHDDVANALRFGYFYQGPPRERVTRERGSEVDLSHVPSLIVATQTHDSVGNQPLGKRLHQLAGIDFQKAAAALNLLYPAIPMVFMGEETAEPNPFYFFVDFKDPWLRDIIEKARRHEHPQQDWTNTVSPLDQQAFLNSKLTPIGDDEPGRSATRAWYRQLIQLRKHLIEQGLLQHAHMNVQFDAAAKRFRLSYENGRQAATVLVQLNGEPGVLLEEVISSTPGTVIASTFERASVQDGLPASFALVM